MGRVHRRQFLVAASALLATPLATAQQQARQYRVGVLTPFGLVSGEQYLHALRERLATHGLVEGRNLSLEARPVVASRTAAANHTHDLVKSKVDAIFAMSTIAAQGAQDATTSVPIVFCWVPDPVVSGIVRDYARPGGNITGISNRFFDLYLKRIELVRELVPGAKTVVVIAGFFDSTLQTAQARVEAAAAQLGLKISRKEAQDQWVGAVEEAAASGADAIMIATPFIQFGMHSEAHDTIRTATRLRVPVIYSDMASVELGGLITYDANRTQDVHRGADYLARVLKGASPATLPIDQASRFELVINLKAAREIGLKIPPVLLLRADRVIE
jgi:putative ABC transport system substrate-binding protein